MVLAMHQAFGEKSSIITLYESLDQYKGKSVHCVDKSNTFDIYATMRLYKKILTGGYTVVHCHLSSFMHVLPIIILIRLLRIDVIYTLHNLAEYDVGYNRMKIRLFQFLSDMKLVKFVTISPEVTNSFERLIKRKPYCQIYNGVDVDHPANKIASEKSDVFNMVCVANFKEQKRHDRLLQIAASLIGELKFHLYLVGDGSLKQDSIELAKKLGLSDLVTFTGSVSCPKKFYEKSDIFVLASDFEGHPLSVLEAMSHGLPVVSTPAGGVSSIIQDPETGFICKDVESFRKTILRLAADPYLLNTVGRAARFRVQNVFSEEVMISNYRSLYENSLL